MGKSQYLGRKTTDFVRWFRRLRLPGMWGTWMLCGGVARTHTTSLRSSALIWSPRIGWSPRSTLHTQRSSSVAACPTWPYTSVWPKWDKCRCGEIHSSGLCLTGYCVQVHSIVKCLNQFHPDHQFPATATFSSPMQSNHGAGASGCEASLPRDLEKAKLKQLVCDFKINQVRY